MRAHLGAFIVRGNYTEQTFLKLLDEIAKCSLYYVILFIKYDKSIEEKVFFQCLIENPKIKSIILYGAPSDKIFATIDEKPVILAIKDYLEFGKTYIDINYFRVGSNSFYESLNYNYGLNQKLFIDSLGDIFLSFGFPIKIGNLFNDKIEEILSNEKVKEFWKVTKDDVFICDNCEYRYMCFDEGELVRINAKYKKKVECPYNPFISKWDYQEGYMNLNECGIYIQNDKLVIDENRLNHINEELYT